MNCIKNKRMGVTYLPAGYSDSEDEDDFLDDKPRVKPKVQDFHHLGHKDSLITLRAKK